MHKQLVTVVVGAMLFSSAQAASTSNTTKAGLGPVKFTSSYITVQAGDHQATSPRPSALLLLSVGLFGIVAVARREPT